MHFTPDELEYLRNMIEAWIDEGFERPPYDKEVYSIIQKLGITEGGSIGQYDITPPPEMREYLTGQADTSISLPRAAVAALVDPEAPRFASPLDVDPYEWTCNHCAATIALGHGRTVYSDAAHEPDCPVRIVQEALKETPPTKA